MSGRYPTTVDIAWKVVEQLVQDWMRNPEYWNREIDLQAELVSRLNAVYRLIGFGEVVADPDNKRYWYARAACEPHVTYQVNSGQFYRAHPDVVVWADLDNAAEISDYWPILWACELKYCSRDPGEDDLIKLDMMARQGKVQYGCILRLDVDRSSSKTWISWDRDTANGKDWKCSARAPLDWGGMVMQKGERA